MKHRFTLVVLTPRQLRVRNLKTLTETNASYEAIIERAPVARGEG